jgi:carbon monoxide dehydrogenase subunit G
MFTVKAGYSDDVEFQTSIEKVREFFTDITNFAELMPGIASIHTDAKGVAHWKIQAEIPLVGQMMQKFRRRAEREFAGADRMVSRRA